MGFVDKVKNSFQDISGKAKQQKGQATGDRRMEAEGNRDQTKAKVKKAGENIKDTFK